MELTYANPQLDLLEGNRVLVGLNTDLAIQLGITKKALSGKVLIEAQLRYDADKQSFYLDGAEFKELDIDGVPKGHEDKVREFTSKVASSYLNKLPVYTLNDKDFKNSAAKALVKDFYVKKDAIVIQVGLK